MRRAAAATVSAAAALGLALPAVAHGPEGPATVAILFQSYDPPIKTILAGDPVTWTNISPRAHTVTARNGRFDSGAIQPTGSYAQRFAASGLYPYFCRIHPTIQGSVEVRPLLLKGPTGALAGGTAVELEGRAIPGVSSVTIQEDRGSGFRALSTAPVTGGRFHVLVRPQQSSSYRAVAGPHVSPSVRLVVGRPLALTARRRGRKSVRLTVKAVPAQPGAPVVLETWLKERFGWWPVTRRRLDRAGVAHFTVRRRSRGRRMRTVLTEPDGARRGFSNVVKISRVRR